MAELSEFKFWCQKVLPLVYDDSLSYYEVLCKVVDYLNNITSDVNGVLEEVQSAQQAITEVQDWLKNFDTTYLEEVIQQKLASMIFIEISNSGYILYYIPDTWTDITFNTTDLDIEISGYDYGHLVLSY